MKPSVFEKYPGEIRRETLSYPQALKLLNGDFPIFQYKYLKDLDLRTKEFWRNDPESAYYWKVILGRNYVHYLNSDSQTAKQVRLCNAAFAFDRAAKNANILKWSLASIICGIKACRLYGESQKLGQLLDLSSRDLEGLEFNRENCAITLFNSINNPRSDNLEEGMDFLIPCAKPSRSN
jgi:hypothetical protein